GHRGRLRLDDRRRLARPHRPADRRPAAGGAADPRRRRPHVGRRSGDPMTTPAHVLPFDARPLTEPIDPRAARAFARELRASGRAPSLFPGSAVFGLIIAVVILFVFASVVTAFIGAMADASGPSMFIPLLPLLLVAGVAIAVG